MRFHELVHGIYFDDLDALQILHNSRYLLLIERTIGSFFRHLGWTGMRDVHKHPDQFHLIRANHIEYHRPVTSVGDVRVRVWVERLGTSSLTFGFKVLPLDEDREYASCRDPPAPARGWIPTAGVPPPGPRRSASTWPPTAAGPTRPCDRHAAAAASASTLVALG